MIQLPTGEKLKVWPNNRIPPTVLCFATCVCMAVYMGAQVSVCVLMKYEGCVGGLFPKEAGNGKEGTFFFFFFLFIIDSLLL